MNNQVLRRKLFDTVLRDARQPQGILASSSELADTVQRRANGGMQTDDYEMRLIPKLAAEGNVKALEGIATGTGYSTRVRLAARDALGSVTAKKSESPTLSAITDFLGGTGKVARPVETESGGIFNLIKQGVGKMGSDLREITDPIDRKLGYLTYDETPGMGLPTGDGPAVSTPMPATDLITPEDDEFGNLADGRAVPTKSTPRLGELEALDEAVLPMTAGEQLSTTSVSGADTQTQPSKEKSKGTSATTVSLLDPITIEDAADLDPETSKAAIKKGTEDVLNSDADNITKNDAILELTNKKDPEKKLSLKERAKANIELYEELLGESPEEDYNINNFLMDFGVAIASGRSDNALENITAALKPTVDKMTETKERKRARKDKIKMLGIQDAIASEKQEKQWERELIKLDKTQAYDWRKTLRAEGFAIDKLDAQIAASRSDLILKLNTQIKMANNQQLNQAKRDAANNEAAFLRTQLNALPDAHQAAAFEFSSQGFDLSDPNVMKQYQDRVEEISTNLVRTTTKTGPLAPEQSRYVLDAMSKESSMDQARIDLQGQGITNPSSQDFENYFAAQYQRITGVQGSAPAQQAQKQVPSFETQPSNSEIQKLVDSGVTQIKIGDITYNIGQANTTDNP